jgi:hypothetical protein
MEPERSDGIEMQKIFIFSCYERNEAHEVENATMEDGNTYQSDL